MLNPAPRNTSPKDAVKFSLLHVVCHVPTSEIGIIHYPLLDQNFEGDCLACGMCFCGAELAARATPRLLIRHVTFPALFA